MQDLFYCTDRSTSLQDLVESLRDGHLVSSVRYPTRTSANVQNDSVWVNLYQIAPPLDEFGEEPQREVLRSLEIRTIVQFSFRETLLREVKPYLALCLTRFGGWVGLDDGRFAERFDLGNLDQIEEALRRLATVPEDEVVSER